MKRVGPLLSLMQQAALALTIGALASLVWFFEASFRTYIHSSFGLWFILYFATEVAGFIASIWISYDLHTGIESGRWPEIEIDRFRATFDKRWLTGLVMTLAVLVIVLVSFDLMSHHLHHVSGSTLGLLFFSQLLSQFLMAVRRPRTTSPHIDWRNAPPMTSDHWGQ